MDCARGCSCKDFTLLYGGVAFSWGSIDTFNKLFKNWSMDAPYLLDVDILLEKPLYTEFNRSRAAEIMLGHRRMWHESDARPKPLEDLVVDLRYLNATRPEIRSTLFLELAGTGMWSHYDQTTQGLW
jgi:hypothetical protein